MSQTTRKSYRIARLAGQQGARHPVRNQADGEKCTTGTNSAHPQAPVEQLNEETLQPATQDLQEVTQSNKRNKWTREEYKQVMEAFITAQLKPSGENNTKQTYTIWRNWNPTTRLNIDANKLANVRRDIIRQKRITDEEMDNIRRKVNQSIQINENSNEEDVREQEGDINSNETDQPMQIETTQPMQIETTQDIQNTNSINEETKYQQLRNDIIQRLIEIQHQELYDRDMLPKITNDRKTKQLIKQTNGVIEDIIASSTESLDLTLINQLCYAAASVVTEMINPKKKKQHRTRKQPKWKEDIEKDIKRKRNDLSLLTEMEQNRLTNQRKVRQMKKRYTIKNMTDIPQAKEKLKQQIQAKAQRIRRYEKRSKQFRQNKIFKTDAKKFYRELGKGQITVKEPPPLTEIEEFWSKIWEDEKHHNDTAQWISDEQNRLKDQPMQEWKDIETAEVTLALKKASNWKSPGIDKVPNFWLKQLEVVHEYVAREYTGIIKTPTKCPEWLTQGLTYLLPKTEETKNPKNYRPITCLPTMYKILTSVITERTYNFLEVNNMLPPEQKGCKRGSYGCKDQLLINKMILEDSKVKKKNLSTAWVDYRKAFDSVPHSWIIRALEIYRISPALINFMKITMKFWKTTMMLRYEEGSIKTRPIQVRSGIFQGDSLSPLLFCLSLAPLSTMLNNTKRGYDIQGKKISHLFYMDDLKTFAKNDSQQEELLHTVKLFSDDICMKFGLDKCAKATFKKGKLTATSDLQLELNTVIKELDQEGTYKYLGVNEGDGIQHAAMKEKIRKEYYRRVRLAIKSELNAANKIEAINTLAVPVVTYSFNIINWQMKEIKKMDTKTRKLMTTERMHHPKSDVERVYLPRKIGGRGLTQLEMAFQTTTVGLKTYLETTEDQLLSLVLQHERNKKLYSVSRQASKYIQQMNIPPLPRKEEEPVTQFAKRIKQEAKKSAQKKMTDTWKEKPMHGQYPARVSKPDAEQDQTHQWLRSAGLKAETEGMVIAAQDQSLATRSYHHKIIKDGTDPKCRMCNQYEETIDHIVSGCPTLAKTEYIQRHDKAAGYIHWKICKYFQLPTAEKWYEHQPQTVTENNNITVLWDMPINTDREIKANRPDIIIKNREDKTCFMIDMTVPSERNVSIKELEKLSKYKDLEIEITRMWGMKTTTIPVVIGALGLIKKGLENRVKLIPGAPAIHELQKIVLLGTSHIIRRTLSIN